MNATLNIANGFEATGYVPVVNTLGLEKNLREVAGHARHAAMFVAAPIIGLAFVIALPLIGLAMLAWLAVRTLPARAKDIALFAAAPFIGLAYIATFPVIGFGALVWAGVKAARAK